MSIHVLDACALTAYLRAEMGREVVAGVLADPNNTNFVHAVNLCEVYYDTLRDSGTNTAQQALQIVFQAGVLLRDDLSPSFWQLVGDLKVSPGKLSLADCFALALAIRTGGTLVTSDHHEFDAVVPLGLCPILFVR